MIEILNMNTEYWYPEHIVYRKRIRGLFCFLAEVSSPWSEKVGLCCHAKP